MGKATKATKAHKGAGRPRFADVLAERTVAMQGEIDALRHALASTTAELDTAIAERDSARKQVEAERREYISAKAEHESRIDAVRQDRASALRMYVDAKHIADANAEAMRQARSEAHRIGERLKAAARIDKFTAEGYADANARVWAVLDHAAIFLEVTP